MVVRGGDEVLVTMLDGKTFPAIMWKGMKMAVRPQVSEKR
jgi:hypothetical protein